MARRRTWSARAIGSWVRCHTNSSKTRETSEEPADPVASIVDQSFVHAHGDHPIDVVLERFAQSGGILPVVSRADAHRVEGVITIDSIAEDRRAPVAHAGITAGGRSEPEAPTQIGHQIH